MLTFIRIAFIYLFWFISQALPVSCKKPSQSWLSFYACSHISQIGIIFLPYGILFLLNFNNSGQDPLASDLLLMLLQLKLGRYHSTTFPLMWCVNFPPSLADAVHWCLHFCGTCRRSSNHFHGFKYSIIFKFFNIFQFTTWLYKFQECPGGSARWHLFLFLSLTARISFLFFLF